MLDIESLLEERKLVVKKKETLELFVSVNQSISKIEKLLELDPEKSEIQPENSKASNKLFHLFSQDQRNSIQTGASLVERVSNEFNQLRYFVSKGRNFPFVVNMQKRITAVEEILQKGVDVLFLEGIKKKGKDILEKCLRTYSAIDRVDSAHQSFRHLFLRPALKQIITREKLENGRSSSTEGLSIILKEVLEFLFSQVSFLVQLAQNSFHEFNFVGAIWAEVSLMIVSDIPNTFSFALSEVFHRVISLQHFFF